MTKLNKKGIVIPNFSPNIIDFWKQTCHWYQMRDNWGGGPMKSVEPNINFR